MKKLIYIITAFLLVSCGQFATAQTLAQYEEKAETAYAAEKWSKANTYYGILLEIDSLRNDANFYGGHSAYEMRSYKIAEEMLSDIPDAERTAEFALTDYYLGLTKKGLEKYDEAIVHFQMFLERNPADVPVYVQRAQAELDHCEWAADQVADPAPTEVIHLDSSVNTIYTDIAPFVAGEELYFATGAVTTDAARSKNRVAIVKTFNDMNRTRVDIQPGEGDMNVANYQMNDTGDRLVYTVCNTGGEAGFGCTVFQMRKQPDGSWSDKEAFDEKVNMPGYNNTQPALGRTENGTELLFFASDRPGGEGGMDIWCSSITAEGEVSVPVNIGEVNSDRDDVTPFFHTGSQTLYFASEGFKNMGGYDIFASAKEGNNWSAAENIGYPVNGGYDDMYYTFDNASGNAHFVSNRPGGYCEDPQKDCVINDIYRVPLTVRLEALTFNGADNSDLVGTRVELLNLTTGVTDTFFINNSGNDFYFPVLLGYDYRLTATKDGYSTATQDLTTKGVYKTTVLREELVLTPTVTLIVNTYDKITRERLTGTTVILERMTKSETERTLNAADEYSQTYQMAFGSEYSVRATKIGYTDSEMLTFNTIGINEPTVMTKDLYLQPFTGLPITVYFDNDYPNPRTRLTVCDKTYDVTFDRYIQQKSRFMNSYSAGLYGAEKEAARTEVASFFDNEVQVGYDKLTAFSSRLIGYLESGTVDTLEIELRGFASPLAKSQYNEYLTQRRTDSVENHFEQLNGGVLMPYIRNGRLRFTESPFGEEKAPTDLSDKPTNRRVSEFSPEASRERRVRILDIRSKDGSLSGF